MLLISFFFLPHSNKSPFFFLSFFLWIHSLYCKLKRNSCLDVNLLFVLGGLILQLFALHFPSILFVMSIYDILYTFSVLITFISSNFHCRRPKSKTKKPKVNQATVKKVPVSSNQVRYNKLFISKSFVSISKTQ